MTPPGVLTHEPMTPPGVLTWKPTQLTHEPMTPRHLSTVYLEAHGYFFNYRFAKRAANPNHTHPRCRFPLSWLRVWTRRRTVTPRIARIESQTP